MRFLRWLRWTLVGIAALASIALAAAWWAMRSSLPTIDGSLTTAGISAEVSIERDRVASR